MTNDQADQPAPAPPAEPQETLANCGCTNCLKSKPVEDGYPVPHHRRRMVVCEFCGNKRCPHAEYHGYGCTGSNATGQVPVLAGNIAPTTPPAETDAKELPDAPGVWFRNGKPWLVRTYKGGLVACEFESDVLTDEMNYAVPKEFRDDMRGNWHRAAPPARVAELEADLRACITIQRNRAAWWKQQAEDREVWLKNREAAIAELTEKLAAAEQHIALAGGYHARTEREIEIEKQLAADARFIEHTGERTVSYLWLERCRELLLLVDAGRNRVHEAEDKLAAAEAALAASDQEIARLRAFLRRANAAGIYLDGDLRREIDAALPKEPTE